MPGRRKVQTATLPPTGRTLRPHCRRAAFSLLLGRGEVRGARRQAQRAKSHVRAQDPHVAEKRKNCAANKLLALTFPGDAG